MITPRVGDFLLRPKMLGFSHVGVWLGGGGVFHNAPGRGEHVSSIEDFAGGAVIAIESTNADPAAVVSRVRSSLTAPQDYDLLTNNCEHSATKVVSGRSYSRQIVAGLVILIGLGVLYISLRRR